MVETAGGSSSSTAPATPRRSGVDPCGICNFKVKRRVGLPLHVAEGSGNGAGAWDEQPDDPDWVIGSFYGITGPTPVFSSLGGGRAKVCTLETPCTVLLLQIRVSDTGGRSVVWGLVDPPPDMIPGWVALDCWEPASELVSPTSRDTSVGVPAECMSPKPHPTPPPWPSKPNAISPQTAALPPMLVKRLRLDGSFDAGGTVYLVRNVTTLREGVRLGSALVCELQDGAKVEFLEFGIHHGYDGKRIRLRARVMTVEQDDSTNTAFAPRIGWISPQTKDGDRLLERLSGQKPLMSWNSTSTIDCANGEGGKHIAEGGKHNGEGGNGVVFSNGGVSNGSHAKGVTTNGVSHGGLEPSILGRSTLDESPVISLSGYDRMVSI